MRLEKPKQGKVSQAFFELTANKTISGGSGSGSGSGEKADSSRTITEEESSYEQKTPEAPPTSNADKV